VYALESSYLEDTTHYGNVLKGWDTYLTKKESGSMKKKSIIQEDDRLFSKSSYTSFLEHNNNANNNSGNGNNSELKEGSERNGSHDNRTYSKPAKKKKVSVDDHVSFHHK